MNEADITVIGAGVVGLAIAAEAACQDSNVLVIEKNDLDVVADQIEAVLSDAHGGD